MVRSVVFWCLGISVFGLVACSKSERARSTGADLGCTDPSCGAAADGGTTAGPDASVPRDASVRPVDPDGATPPTNGEVVVPPFDRDAGIDNGDATTSLFDVAMPFDTLPPTPDSAVVVPPLPDTTVCANDGTIAFRTDFLEAIDADAGTGIPAATAAFRAAWHNALVETGRPGPALISLSNLGLMTDGGSRRIRFGTPDARIVGDSEANAIFSFEPPSANPQNPHNPFEGLFNVQNTTRVSGSVLGANAATAVLFRFSRADGTRYDIPVVGVSLDAFLRSGLDGKCTALDVVDFAFGIPASALAQTLDGQALSSLLGSPVAPDGGPPLALVHLSGPAHVVPFEEAP